MGRLKSFIASIFNSSDNNGSRLPFKLKRVYSYDDLPTPSYTNMYWDVINITDFSKLDLIYKHLLSTKVFYYYVSSRCIEGRIDIKDRGLIHILIFNGDLEFGIYKSGVRYDVHNLYLHSKLQELIALLIHVIRKEYNKDYNL